MKEEKKDVLGYPYKFENMDVGKASLTLFDLVNQRQIRDTQVNSILRGLKKGEHFDSLFVVNVNNGIKRARVIDGGHRIQALRRYFEIYPNKKVNVSMAVYKDLTEAEERAVFTKWNLGVKQTVDDFINSYKDEIPEFDSMVDELPVSVYGSKNKMRLRYIVDAYLSSKQCPYTGGTGFTRLDWLEALRKIDYDDIQSMNDTFKIIKETFNSKDIVDFTRLSAFKFSNFKMIYRLIHVNKVLLGRNYIIKRMKKVLLNSTFLEQNRHAQRQGVIEAFNICMQMLNSGVDHKFK